MDLVAFISSLPWEDAFNVIWPAAQFVAGMALYSVFIFKFYRFIAKRDIFHIDYSKYGEDLWGTANKFVLFMFNIVEYILLFPLFVIFWFGAIAALLALLSKGQSIESILMISISVVTAVRVTAYYSEDLSRDLAKMLPFVLLGVFLVDMTFFSLDASVSTLLQIPAHWEKIAYYCIFVVLLEMVLRVANFFKQSIFPKKAEEKE
ncbi:MAG: hypothetical protein JW834_00130 [Candidatus Diapherotrites archaeon]|nr:hypothetical protein [Candidatus Diapherotrites archaeon]